MLGAVVRSAGVDVSVRWCGYKCRCRCKCLGGGGTSVGADVSMRLGSVVWHSAMQCEVI